MISPNRESYSYLQVDRPILGGGDEFLVKVADLSKHVLGSVVATSLPETAIGDDFMDGGELVTTLRTVDQARAEVFRPTELRMILLRRVIPSEASTRYNLPAKAAAFNAKRRLLRKHSGFANPGPANSVKNELDAIVHRYGRDPNEESIICDRVQDINDPIIGRGLALVPKAGQPANWSLGEQAELSSETLRGISARLAANSSPWSPMVPFVSLPKDTDPLQYERFVDSVNEILVAPVRLIMGAVEAYSSSSVGNV